MNFQKKILKHFYIQKINDYRILQLNDILFTKIWYKLISVIYNLKKYLFILNIFYCPLLGEAFLIL